MLRIITLIFALSLIIAIVDAHNDTPLARRHAPAVHRMFKKRALLGLTNADNAAAAPGSNSPLINAAAQPNAASSSATDGQPATPTNTDQTPNNPSPSSQQPANNQPSVTAKTTANPVPSAVQTTPSAQTTSATQAGLIPTAVTILGGGQPSNLNTSASAPTSASTSASTSSTPLTASSSSSTPSTTQSSTPTVTPQSQTGIDAVTITSSESPTASSTASPQSNSVTTLQRNTIIILVAIGASIGAAGIIWTIIRKWKFRPSSSFEDRMQPIDWQPTTEPHGDHDITEKLNRAGSTRSHGSFTSGNNHDNPTVDLPPHDFTAGPAHLAPVGGYADLQRGPSPQPDLQRGQSFRTPSPYQYDIPNPHGQYYNGAGAGAGAGAYQAGYDYNRGY